MEYSDHENLMEYMEYLDWMDDCENDIPTLDDIILLLDLED